jgi:membrane protein DedA with SNARE-associated domain
VILVTLVPTDSLLQAAALILGTFASEDLTCITAGQLLADGKLPASTAVIGCLVGIYAGDLALFFVGRCFGSAARRWIARRSPAFQFERLEHWFDRNAASAIFASRFIPGARLPMYLAAGALGRKGYRFAFLALVAATIWTPLLVLGVASLGDHFLSPLRAYLGNGWIGIAIGVMLLTAVLHVVRRCATPVGRAQLIATISRIWRWEFWPMWLFYPPIAVWIAWLAMRHRGITVPTAANPNIPLGGIAGESKYEILSSSNSPHVSKTALIAERTQGNKIERFNEIMRVNGWEFPVILKPDIGERGTAVKLIKTPAVAESYLAASVGDVIVQPYHPGPFEAGIFYYRYPNKSRGRIYSITDKRFPQLTGDGLSRIEQLIWRHPRFRMQAHVFLERHKCDLDRVLANGEEFRLAVAGNHCQGTLFCDGSHLITDALTQKIDQIAKTFPQFFVGRFDVRYSDVERFKAGEDLTIIELNGITSESTNIYDPSWTLLRAYRTLMRQWSIIFRIGAMNRSAGSPVSSITQIWRAVSAHSQNAPVSTLSD